MWHTCFWASVRLTCRSCLGSQSSSFLLRDLQLLRRSLHDCLELDHFLEYFLQYSDGRRDSLFLTVVDSGRGPGQSLIWNLNLHLEIG